MENEEKTRRFYLMEMHAERVPIFEKHPDRAAGPGSSCLRRLLTRRNAQEMEENWCTVVNGLDAA